MFKRFLFLTLALLWVSEPFLSFTTLPTTQHRICPNCGMEDMCGDICCCVGSETLCSRHSVGLYPSGCNPDHARQFFFSQSAVKFLPQNAPILSRYASFRHFSFNLPTFNNAFVSILSPPPRSGYFA